MRPRHAFVLPVERNEALSRIANRLADADSPCEGVMAGHHVELLVRPDERHFWSPWLSVDVLSHPDGIEVRCRFGPHPHIWTGFMSAFALLAFTGLAGLVFGCTQLLIKQAPTGLLAMIPALGLSLALYWASLVGQRLGAPQMQHLYSFLRAALADAGAGSERPT